MKSSEGDTPTNWKADGDSINVDGDMDSRRGHRLVCKRRMEGCDYWYSEFKHICGECELCERWMCVIVSGIDSVNDRIA